MADTPHWSPSARKASSARWPTAVASSRSPVPACSSSRTKSDSAAHQASPSRANCRSASLEDGEGLGGVAAADGLDREQGVRQRGAELLAEAGEQLAALRGRGGAVGVGVDDAGAGPAGDGQRLQCPRPRRG